MTIKLVHTCNLTFEKLLKEKAKYQAVEPYYMKGTNPGGLK
jgi:hypothetical protein